ncbi:OSBPL9 isoform 22, partial [Pongo abelii]
ESIKHCIVLLQIAKDQSNAEKHADGMIPYCVSLF